MDSEYNFSMLQHDIGDTNEKLQYYTKLIVFLVGELQALREAVCAACKQKCAAPVSTNRSSKASNDSTLAIHSLKQRNIEEETSASALPRMSEMNAFWRTPAPGSSSPPINDRIRASDSNSFPEISTELNTGSKDLVFYARQDGLADMPVDVKFVHSFCHKNYVPCVCFSCDGMYLAAAKENDDGGSVVIYEVESLKTYCELKEYASQYGSYTRPAILYLSFSSNGKHLAVADLAGRIIIWDVPNRRIHSIFYGTIAGYQVLFSPDGRFFAVYTNAGLLVLNVRDNSRKMVSQGSYFDFSPSGQFIAAGHDGGGLAILEVRTGRAVKRWNGYGTILWRVKFTADGRGLVCAYEGVIEHWNVNDAEPVLIRKFDVLTYFCGVAISPDQQLLASPNEIWNFNSGKCQYTLNGHNDDISSVDFSAAGTYLAMGSYDGVGSLWKYTWAYVF